MTGVLSFFDPPVSDMLYKFAKAFINLEHSVCLSATIQSSTAEKF